MKCYNCTILGSHFFKDCLSSTCQCNCVQQLKYSNKNTNLEDMKAMHPFFLEISDGNVAKLPELSPLELKRFTRIDKTEWIKIDRRTKEYRKKR